MSKKKYLILLDPFTGGDALIETALSMNIPVYVISCLYNIDSLIEKFRDVDVTFKAANTTDVTTWFDWLPIRGEVLGILPGGDLSMERASLLAEAYELPFLNLSAVSRNCVYKDLMRQAVEYHGIPQPNFAIINFDKLDDLDAELNRNQIDFPCIVKPTDLGGSLNVRSVNTIEELNNAIQVIKDFNLFEFIKPNSSVTFDRRRTIIVEQQVTGPEFSVEGVISSGSALFTVVTEKTTTDSPLFIETGHIVPTINYSHIQDELVHYALKVTRALGIVNSPFHCEIKYTDCGPRLIECASRLGGDKIPNLVRQATGVDLYEAAIMLATGAVPNVTPKVKRFASIQFLLPETSGVIQDIKGLDVIRHHPMTTDCQLTIERGQRIDRTFSVFDRMGHFCCVADNSTDLADGLQSCSSALSIEIAK